MFKHVRPHKTKNRVIYCQYYAKVNQQTGSLQRITRHKVWRPKMGHKNARRQNLNFPCPHLSFWKEGFKSSVFSDLKCHLHVDKRPKHKEKPIFTKIPVYMWARLYTQMYCKMCCKVCCSIYSDTCAMETGCTVLNH